MDCGDEMNNILKIAIVDDDDPVCSQVESFLFRIKKKYDIHFEIDIYNSGDRFQSHLQNGEFYDVVFLDIEMTGLTGIDVSKNLRQTFGNESTQIVYISGKTEYAIEVFDYDPIHFLPKPLTEEKIEKAFVKLMHKLNLKAEAFAYKIKHDNYKVAIRDILYFENNKRKVIIYFRNQRDEFYGDLDSIEQQLRNYHFVRIHKSYLINTLHARKFTYETVEMSNHTTLQIAQSKRKEVRAMQFELNQD